MIAIRGMGLHTGTPVCATLRSRPGELGLRRGNDTCALRALVPSDGGRSTLLSDAAGRVWARTVEHFFGALAGLGIYSGVELELDADELPLLDGGALAWCDALGALGPIDTTPRPRLSVRRHARVQVLASEFEFSPGPQLPEVKVELVTSDPRLAAVVSWDGSPEQFRSRIAPSRTFALAHEVLAFADRDLAKFVDPRSVLVIGDEILSAGEPFRRDEPASHKLLDLLGDMLCYGGPPIGSVFARRPGHAANHAAMTHALSCGILGPADA